MAARETVGDLNDSMRRDESRIRAVTDFVFRVSRVVRDDIVWQQLKDFAARLGLPYLHVVATLQPTSVKFRQLLYTDSPGKLIEVLNREWPFTRSPVLNYSRASLKPFAMSEVEGDPAFAGFDWRKFAPPKARRGDALVVPIADGQLDAVAIFSGPKPDMRSLPRALLQVAAQFAFLRVRSLAQSGTAKREPNALSKRERDCLRLAAAGKSDAQIAESVGISLRTVRFHFANAKSKLGASNRSEAIAIAATARG